MANEIENMFMNKHLQAQLAEDEYIIEKAPEMLNVDNRTTALSPQFAGTGSHLRDQMLQMEQEQALVDNTLDFVPLAKFGSIVEGAKGGGRMVARSDEVMGTLSDAKQKLGSLNELTLKNNVRALSDEDFASTLFGNIKDSSRGVGTNLKRIAKGKETTKLSPTYREVPFLRGRSNAGDNADLGGVFVSGNNSNSILLAKNLRQGDDMYAVFPKARIDRVKRHEYNHNEWGKKYNMGGTPIKPKGKDFGSDNAYLGAPEEVNARAREIQYLWSKKNKTHEDLQELQSLIDRTEPFLEGFAQLYPDELGTKVYNRLKKAKTPSYLNMPKIGRQ